ncbi:MAG: hypothetical protein J6T89_00790 [Bacteroidales bacterium]|nr:hypothetical protein [Bacteroidales bacterium]
MTPEQVFEGLKEVLSVVRPNTDMSSVGPDTQLVRDLGIDSLSMMLVSLAVEEKFQMRFDTSAPAPTTVGEVIDAVLKAI